MWFLWLLLSYYVLSMACWGLLVWVSSAMYVETPWIYLRAVLLPFVGFWLFLILWLDDLRVYFENEDTEARNRQSE